MKKINSLIIVAIISLFPATLKSQVLSDLSIAPAVKQRMEKSIMTAIAYPAPEWCNTTELQRDRKIIIEKSIKTLYHNYLAPIAKIRFEGVVPSPTTFNGLWSWDSWKHAAALAYIDKDLAENSIRGLYDFQDPLG